MNMEPWWISMPCLAFVLACESSTPRDVSPTPRASGQDVVPAPLVSDADAPPARRLFKGVVERISERPDGVDVSLRPYAALYHLRSSHPHYRAYIGLLHQSLESGRSIRFGYAINDNELTVVEADP